MKYSNNPFYYALLLFILISCSSSKITTKKFKKADAVSSYFQGFVLYDPVRKEQLINYNGSKYFTPASNTKLFTFYAAYKVLKDSIKALEYARSNDSLFIRGTADPSFLYGFDSTKVVNFLNKDSASIFLVNTQIDEPTLGSGWSWDDYPYSYMPEKNIFPLYGNLVKYSIRNDSLISIPTYFKDSILIKDSISTTREINSNTFYIGRTDTLQRTTPFKTSNKSVAALLEKLLNKRVQVVTETNTIDYQSLYATSRDSILKKMLVVSDN
ncbi:MAG: D-alanyl-D-alanine carboxypeptidase, partial [Flavobacteriaceae bacterium]|nr:D-alanyl-D-alanine carboxypeptidase [Flavobacteriaceae bacterium]